MLHGFRPLVPHEKGRYDKFAPLCAAAKGLFPKWAARSRKRNRGADARPGRRRIRSPATPRRMRGVHVHVTSVAL